MRVFRMHPLNNYNVSNVSFSERKQRWRSVIYVKILSVATIVLVALLILFVALYATEITSHVSCHSLGKLEYFFWLNTSLKPYFKTVNYLLWFPKLDAANGNSSSRRTKLRVFDCAYLNMQAMEWRLRLEYWRKPYVR